MATIYVPLDEAVVLLRKNLQLPPAFAGMESTPEGLRVNVRPMMLAPMMRITVRFLRFDRPTAFFAVDGLPNFVRLDQVLPLPEGIAANGGSLTVNTDVLIRTQLHMTGLSVRDVSWDGRGFRIETAAG